MAGFRTKVKKNTPKVELHSIMSLVVGTYKTGKTRLWKEVTELHYEGDTDATLLIAFEPGYETWELDNLVPVHEEGSEDELYKVWDYFKNEVVKGLVQEAKDGRIVKLVGIDTADRCIDACSAWLINNRNKKYGKKFTSIQEITNNTDENGWTALYEELKKPFDMLRNSGYGIMTLAWSKEKETTLYNGLKFNSIELMMNNTARKVFESQASLICCLHNEIIVTDKEGNELETNIKDKKGKDKASNFHETKTVMCFRPTEYVSIAGGRYTDLPDKVDYSAENFLQVFENAVKGQLKKTDKSVEQLKVEEEQSKDEKAKEFAEKIEEHTNETPEGLIEQINAAVEKMSPEQKQSLSVKLKEEFKGNNNYKKYDNVDQLKKALEIATNV